MEKLKQNPIVKKLGLNRILLVCILILSFIFPLSKTSDTFRLNRSLILKPELMPSVNSAMRVENPRGDGVGL